MWRFVLTENIRRFQLLIARARSQGERDTLQLLLEDAEHELAELEQASTPEAARRDAALRYFAEHAGDVQNRSGELIAVLSICFGKPQAFSEGELERTANLAKPIGIGLEQYVHVQANEFSPDSTAMPECS